MTATVGCDSAFFEAIRIVFVPSNTLVAVAINVEHRGTNGTRLPRPRVAATANTASVCTAHIYCVTAAILCCGAQSCTIWKTYVPGDAGIAICRDAVDIRAHTARRPGPLVLT